MLHRVQYLKNDVIESKKVLDKLPKRNRMSNYIFEKIQLAILKSFKDTYFIHSILPFSYSNLEVEHAKKLANLGILFSFKY